uniref:WD repeat-containing protein 7 n=1 Tax=Bursaphelenchus xylophilus TaxID=6326 RepID=A0A1I7SSR8_BURXY
MPQKRSGLVVPVILWGSKPPSNSITHLTAVNQGQTIISGGKEGQLVQWTVDQDNWIQPQSMMIAHSAPISCLAPALKGPHCSRYVSCSEDGLICLWNSNGAKVVESACQQYVHRKIVSYTFSSDDHALPKLFCIGDYSEVIILDALDLNITCFLRSRIESDWLNTMTLVYPNEKLLGITVSGVIKMWGLQDLEKKDPTSLIYEDEAKPLGLKSVRAICCSRQNSRMMLVITATSWQIIDPSALHQLIVSQTAIEAVNGTIIDIDRIAVGFADSTVVLFQLPRSRLVGKNVRDRFGDRPVPLGNIEHPFVFAILRGIKTADKIPSRATFYFETRANDTESKVVYRADNKGKMSLWSIPKNFDALVEEFIRKRNPTVYDPTTRQSFGSVWERLNPPPPSIIKMEDSKPITATIYISCQGKLLLGRNDGSIVMTHAFSALSSQLFEASSEVQHRVLQGHTSAVQCFLYPFQQDERYDPEIFLSGGLDFAVIVWNLSTGTKLHRFCSQGGPILRMLVLPENCNPRLTHCICSVAGDNSAALLSLKEKRCILLASRQQSPIQQVKWRPLDDFMLLKCEDGHVYVWQMETGNLDRIVGGVLATDVLAASDEQSGITEIDDKASASQAVRMLRAIKNKNIDAIKQVVSNNDSKKHWFDSSSTLLPSPMDIVQLKKSSNDVHMILFNVDALITGLKATDEAIGKGVPNSDSSFDRRQSLSTLITRKSEGALQNHLPYNSNNMGTVNRANGVSTAKRWQMETNLYMNTAKLLVSLLHGWNLDENVDNICVNKLKLQKPKAPICFGTISKKGFVSLSLPFCTGKSAPFNDLSFRNFSLKLRWKDDPQLTTIHLLSLVSISNAMMSLKSRILQTSHSRPLLRRVPSTKSTDTNESDSEGHLVRQGWSHVASMHCVLISELVKPPDEYASPDIELVVRRWHDSCVEIKDAAQALLIRELSRMSKEGRRALIDHWTPFLPTLLDPSISIFGYRDSPNGHKLPSPPQPNFIVNNTDQKVPPPRPAPPIPPRKGAVELPEVNSVESSKENVSNITSNINMENADTVGGLHQVRRNQATAVVLLGVFGAEFPKELPNVDLTRSISHALVELLVSEETPLLPAHSALRRAAIDLIGRGFTVWQPHIDLSKVLLGLLALTSIGEDEPDLKGPISPEVDSFRTARHALSLIASSRAKALINALSMEVARYNSLTQHQTVQQNIFSPLMKSRNEVLRLLEQLSEKHYNDVADMITPVGDILVHCLDINRLKQNSLAEIFPPIAKFYMVGYCGATRRVAFGGKNGSIVVHDLKAAKAQTIAAHKAAITALSFSQDGKYMAAYSAQDAKISFWQSQQTFLGMGQNQIRCVKTLPAPSEFPVVSPGGTYQPFRARLVWINNKSLTLMLPNGKENRFSV